MKSCYFLLYCSKFKCLGFRKRSRQGSCYSNGCKSFSNRKSRCHWHSYCEYASWSKGGMHLFPSNLIFISFLKDLFLVVLMFILAPWKKARAGIQEVHFLPFNPTDKRTALTYIDSDGKMHRVSKGAPEQVIGQIAWCLKRFWLIWLYSSGCPCSWTPYLSLK